MEFKGLQVCSVGVPTPGVDVLGTTVVGDGLVPSRRALRARVENAPHSRGKRPNAVLDLGAGDHKGRPYGLVNQFNGLRSGEWHPEPGGRCGVDVYVVSTSPFR